MQLPPDKRFTVIFLGIMLLGAAVLLAFNTGGSGSPSAICAEKAEGGQRVLLLGTSRTRYGMGPEVRDVLGPAVNGARLVASFETMRSVLAQWNGGPGDRVIIEASPGTLRRNGLEHLNAAPSSSGELAARLDIAPTLRDLLHLEDRQTERMDCNGYPIKAREPARADIFRRDDEALAREASLARTQDAGDAREGLKALVEDALGRGLVVDLWIPPVPACYLEAYRRSRTEGALEEWTVMVAGMKDGRGAGQVTVWDFSGFSAVTTEPLPYAGSEWRSRYFSDLSHFLRHVGLRIARRMAGAADEGFGVHLDPASVAGYLETQRAARHVYLLAAPEAARACVRDGLAPD